MRMHRHGFTIIEIMVVVGIIAILALMAVPSFQERLVKEQILEALPLADLAKAPIAAAWGATQTFPADNAAAGLPPAEKIVSNFISSVMVQDGVIHITFGNKAYGIIKGKVLTLRPATVKDAPIVPVAWVCGFASAPENMTMQGENKTTVLARHLPFKCSAG